jgi:hypothetical protein
MNETTPPPLHRLINGALLLYNAPDPCNIMSLPDSNDGEFLYSARRGEIFVYLGERRQDRAFPDYVMLLVANQKGVRGWIDEELITPV